MGGHCRCLIKMNLFVEPDRLHQAAGIGYLVPGAFNHGVAGMSLQRGITASGLRSLSNHCVLPG